MKIDVLPGTKFLLLKLYIFLAVVESVATFYGLTFIPSSTENAIFAGFSLSRLLLLFIGAVVPFLGFGFVFILISLFPNQLNKMVLFVDSSLAGKWKYAFIVMISSFLVSVSFLFFLMPPDRYKDFFALGQRFMPVIYFGGFLGAQTLLGQFFWRNQKIYFQNLRQWKSLFVIAGLLFAFILVLSVWVSWSEVGLKPEVYGWLPPGTPILFSQLCVALFLGMMFMVYKNHIELGYSNLLKGKKPLLKFEGIIFFLLWLTAFLVWQAEPMRKQSYFTPSPTAPNFEYYPYSDAAFYDATSQSILIGEGRNLDVVLRPMYVFSLVIFHLIGGQNYNVVLTLQILYLAVMPALVFLLVSNLGSQSAGVLSAILIIFREKNSIALTNVIEVSHSKLLMSDLPTMAFMLLFIYALVNWLKKVDNGYPSGIVSGALFGLVMLVRSQTQLLLPVLLMGIAFTGGFQWRKSLQRILIFALGLLIVVTPWVWRNYQVSGKLAVENTGFYARLIAGGYSEPTDVVDSLPGESFDEYNARLKYQIVRYIFNHPLEISRIYMTYFVRNEISSVVYLPMSLKLYDLRSYVDDLRFWDEPYLNLANGSGVMFFIALGFIIFGVAVAYQRLGFLGVFPLLIHFTYVFSIVLARFSGWRFIMPVDWIFQIYYCIGLVHLIVIVVSVVWNKTLNMEDLNTDKGKNSDSPAFFQKKIYMVLAGFLLIGLSLPVIELVMPVRYPTLSDTELIKTYAVDGLQLEGGELITRSALESFLVTEPDAIVIYGRALYPSYYRKGAFWGEASPDLLEVSQFDRLQFNLIGSYQTLVFLPIQNVPQYFPQASDVFIVGCKQNYSTRALIIKVNDQVLTSSPWEKLTCSGTER